MDGRWMSCELSPGSSLPAGHGVEWSSPVGNEHCETSVGHRRRSVQDLDGAGGGPRGPATVTARREEPDRDRGSNPRGMDTHRRADGREVARRNRTPAARGGEVQARRSGTCGRDRAHPACLARRVTVGPADGARAGTTREGLPAPTSPGTVDRETHDDDRDHDHGRPDPGFREGPVGAFVRVRTAARHPPSPSDRGTGGLACRRRSQGATGRRERSATCASGS